MENTEDAAALDGVVAVEALLDPGADFGEGYGSQSRPWTVIAVGDCYDAALTAADAGESQLHVVVQIPEDEA